MSTNPGGGGGRSEKGVKLQLIKNSAGIFLSIFFSPCTSTCSVICRPARELTLPRFGDHFVKNLECCLGFP